MTLPKDVSDRFERMLALHTPYKEMEAFIAQELAKAKEAGRQEAAEGMIIGLTGDIDKFRKESRRQLLNELIEEVGRRKKEHPSTEVESQDFGFNQALDEIKKWIDERLSEEQLTKNQ